MSLTDTQRKLIEANLDRLDYAKGNGLLKTNKKKLLPNEGYLFISAGGTGRKALETIRHQIENTIEPDCIDRVGYLIVDCAHNELNKLVNEGKFKEEQVLKLPFEEAWKLIDPVRLSDDRKLWVDPLLYDQVSGGITGKHEGFEDDGAGAWRQPGRVRLTTENGYNAFKTKLSAAANQLKTKGATGAIKLFFLCSVAGGTGSGTIIDLAYIARHVMNSASFNGIPTKKYYSYIFSPDACEGDINEKHNPHANHIAAMKEIDYLMRTKARGEKQAKRFRYGGEEVKVEASIFDTCFLVDGQGALAFFGDKAPQAARDVVAHTVVSSMTSGVIKDDLQQNLMDSIYSNEAQEISSARNCMDPTDYPRYKGYHFNISGFASLVVPTELLTAVLAHNVLNMLWGRWQTNSTKDDARNFLRSCGIAPRSKVTVDVRTLKDSIELEAQNVIKDNNRGLVYLINLAKDACDLLRGSEYIGHANNHKSDFLGGSSWETTHIRLGQARKMISDLNNGSWEVTRIIYETLRDLLDKDHAILTSVNVYQEHFNKTLYFCPINLTQQQATLEKSNALLNYITSIYTEAERRKIAEDFGNDLFTQFDSAELCGIAQSDVNKQTRFNPAKVIQDLVQEKFGRLINDNIERFLVKFYAADPDAEPTKPDPNEPAKYIATDALCTAAKEIVEILTQNGAPMAVLNDLTIKTKLPATRYITVPAQCKNLIEEIKSIINAKHIGVGMSTKVFESQSTDEFTMVEVYQGLPAYVFNSIAGHEGQYESQIDTPAGIHLVETGDFAHDWRNLPNLAKEPVAREAELLGEAKADYDKAVELGMVIPVDKPRGFNKILRVCSTRDVGKVVDRLKIAEFDQYIGQLANKPLDTLDLESCVNELAAQGIVEYVELWHNMDPNMHQIGKDGTEAALLLSEDQYYDYAWNTLHQMFDLWNEVKVSLKKFEELAEEVNRQRDVKLAEARREQLSADFAFALRAFDDSMQPAIIRFDEDEEKWYIKPEIDEKELADVSYYTHRNAIYKECKEFFAFVEFAKLGDSEIAAIKATIDERIKNTTTRNADKSKGKTLSEEFESVRRRTRKQDDCDFPMATQQFLQEAEKIENGLGERIRAFYDKLISEIRR